MPRRRRVALLLLAPLLVAVAAVPGGACATECRVIAGGTPALAAVPAERRLAWLDRRLADDAARARIWALTWGLAYGAITIVEAGWAFAPQSTPDRAEKVVGASAAFIGVLAGVALPLKVMHDQTWWRAHRARSDDELCAQLNTIELLFIRDAESEAFGVGPLVHVGNFAINIAAGLILGLGYDRWAAFGYTTLVGIAVGEIQASTQPTDVIEDLRLYRAGQLDEGSHRPRLGIALAPLVGRDRGGAVLTLRW